MRDGFTIQARMCPWCWNRLTVRMGSGLSLCFNCRHHWRGASPLAQHGPAQADSQPFARLSLGPREVERLVVYRAAVQSGYYTDWPVKRVA